MLANEGFVILKGSVRTQCFSDASDKYPRQKWEKLQDEGIVKNGVFTKNYLASSPSAAAAMVLGRNTNGLTEWKTQDGKSLKDHHLENGQDDPSH